MTDNTTALVVREYPKLTQLTGFNSAQINLVRQTVAPGLSIVELAWFLYNAKRLELEPLLGQIYAIRYDPKGPPDIVTGINGYRSRAANSGEYAGSDEAVFEYEDVGQPRGAPSKATVTVWRIVQGVRCPFTASALWTEFYPDHGRERPTMQGAQYRKRPHNQLAIRAESHALRKAFPYQTRDMEAQPAPRVWIEAAEADEQQEVEQRADPERIARNSETYSRIYESEYGEEGITSATGSPSAAVEAPPAEAPNSAGAALVSNKQHPLWQEWLKAEKKARQAGFDGDTSQVHLGIPESDLQAAIDTLLADVDGVLS